MLTWLSQLFCRHIYVVNCFDYWNDTSKHGTWKDKAICQHCKKEREVHLMFPSNDYQSTAFIAQKFK